MIKELEYALKIQEAIASLFNEDEENYIDPSELAKDDNLTHFIHALANVVPCETYNKLTGSSDNMLEFNHISNHLCFQYMNLKK